MRGPLDLCHRRAHSLVAEVVDARINAPDSGGKHSPARTAAPRRRRRGLGEGNAGEGTLGDGIERGVVGREDGAECLVKSCDRECELGAPFRQLVLNDVGNYSGCGELGLEVGNLASFSGTLSVSFLRSRWTLE